MQYTVMHYNETIVFIYIPIKEPDSTIHQPVIHTYTCASSLQVVCLWHHRDGKFRAVLPDGFP